MEIIRHRVNTIRELKTIALGLGVEIDLRSCEDEIILSHDPFCGGDTLAGFAKEWASHPRGTLILNPKEDGLESMARECMQKHGVENFFFLDLSLPTTVRLAVKEGFRKVSVRVSEYEKVESALCFEGKAEWAWLDCFHGSPPSEATVRQLKGKFRLCLVSPELHGFSPDTIPSFHSLIPLIDAVCTKHPERWG